MFFSDKILFILIPFQHLSRLYLCLLMDIDILKAKISCSYILSIMFTLFNVFFTVLKIKFVADSFQGSHTGQQDFCNWLADGSTAGQSD